MLFSSPYKFEAPWDKFEFATHVLKTGAKLVVVSMAWITHEDQGSFIQKPSEPDMDTLSYWVSRIEPIIRTESDEEIIVVFANRSGIEQDATYTGSSAVVGVRSGEVNVYGILGRGENKLLVVDTDDQPFAKLVYRPEAKTTTTAAPEPSKSIAREATREINGGGLDSGTSSDSVPSKRQHAGEAPLSQVHAPVKKPSRHEEDDLAVKRYEKDQFDKQSGNRGVHTPLGPSPTPHNIRPQFSSQPAGFNIQARTDVQLPALYHSPNIGGDEPLLLDPEATARRLGLIRNMSPSHCSESPRSDCSISSSKMYWNPQEQSEVQPTRRPQLGNAEQFLSDFDSMNFGEGNRHSARSDIAVWNNEPGHPRKKISFPSASREPEMRSTLHATERQRSSSRDVSRSGNTPRHGPPGMSKSRNDSRAERKDRSVPSILPKPDMVAARERFEDFAQRAETAHGRFESMRESGKSVNTAPLERDSRTADSNRQRSVRPPSQSKVKRKPSKRSMSVPFAIDSGPARDPNPSNKTVRERSTSTTGVDPPILRPASRSRINRETRRGRGIEASSSTPDNTVLNTRTRSATQDHRAMSKGRTQSATPLDTHSEAPVRSRNTRHDAHKRHESAQDATDLARTRMIEEYSALNRPPRGSRSRSRAGNQSSSRQKSSGTPRLRQQASFQQEKGAPTTTQTTPRLRQQASFQQEKGTPKTTQITPRTGNRRVPDSAKVPFKLTTDLTKPSRGTESSALQSQHRQNGHVNGVPSSAPVSSPEQDPKTPVAMILIADIEGTKTHSDMSWLPTSKGVGRGTEVNIAPLGVGY